MQSKLGANIGGPIAFGTYKVGFIPASASAAGASPAAPLPPAKDIIAAALAAGYRVFDCAQFYGNEADIGAALRDSGVPRAELTLISKVWNDAIYSGRAAVRAQACAFPCPRSVSKY